MEKEFYDKCAIGCKIRTLWHGTTLGRAENILKDGFKPITLMEGEQAGEGYSSCHYEGGLYFFGKDTKTGKKIAHRHAYRAAKQFNDKPALLKIKACICNELTKDKITKEFKKNVEKKAKKETYEMEHDPDAKAKYCHFYWNRNKEMPTSIGHRYTYANIRDFSAYDFLETGVMTSYGIKIADIMEWLGIDASDGFEGTLVNKPTTTMLKDNKPIMKIELIELPEHEEIPEVGK